MSPTHKPPGRIAPSFDIPLLTEVVEEHEEVTSPVTRPMEQAAAPQPQIITIPQDLLSEMLTERIAALTDRLLRDASAEIHATLVNKVWEKLREEIPAIVEAALKENGKD
ncbi:MAG TPA: hypothetical protein VGO35_05250 [Gammaproteobacteria bacterium]|jgi:hypothetical protein|nr:hypothetical protein [Gammaproteobacteria bacterium]